MGRDPSPGSPERRHRQRASFWMQAGALTRKQAAYQKRKWLSNAALLSGPFLICMLLWVLQNVINQQLDSRDFRCGCKCLACCDWVAGDASGNGTDASGSGNGALVYQCYQATDERPCSPYAKCQSYNDSECGFLYSTADQVGFCPVAEPPLWPALLDVPQEQYRGSKAPDLLPNEIPTRGIPPSDAPMLFTGGDSQAAERLMGAMWARQQPITDAVMAAYIASQAAGGGGAGGLPSENSSLATEAEFVAATAALARGLYQFDIVMGTSADTSISLLMEPAFVSQSGSSGANTSAAAARPPLYFALPNCSALSDSDRATLDQVGQAITNLTGAPVECASLPPAWQVQRSWINDQVYCGWGAGDCVMRAGQKVFLPLEASQARAGGNASIQEFVSALYDWHNTAPGRLNVSVWVNNTNIGGGQANGAQGPPEVQRWSAPVNLAEVQRWSAPVNLAANAYLKDRLGAGYGARLVGVKDMPTGASRLSLDFSSLLGPLFSMWLLQLILPVGVHTLVSEKEQHLRVMMKMQGLSDGPYYFVMWGWHLLLYCAFVMVFCIFGGLIGLKIFTLNSYSLQAVFYFVWGLSVTSWTFYFSSLWKEARPAVLLSVIWIIISGFMANLVLVQYIEQGPHWIATALQWIPSFNLYRGLYELSQYAFLANRTGGTGLTWSKLSDPDCGMVDAMLICGIEAIVLMAQAYYVEQVAGTGSGIPRHRLFFLGFKNKEPVETTSDGSKRQRAKRGWRALWPFGRNRGSSGGSGGNKMQQGAVALSPQSVPSSSGAAGGNGSAGNLHPQASLPASTSAGTGGYDEAAAPSPWVESYYGSLGAGPQPSPHLPLRGQYGSAGGTPDAAAAEAAAVAAAAASAAGQPVVRKPTSLWLSVTAETGSIDGMSEGEGGEAAEGADVASERARVEALWQQWQRQPEQAPPAAIMLRSLRKVFPARDGNAPKVAVADLWLAIPRCECFGLLGPNGAGKTTTIRMMEGFMRATGGQAIIEGFDISRDMDSVYALMGACPQHDLLWDGLTGREHLLFYARIKNLRGKALRRAVDDGLRAVNLFSVGDDLVGGYSGGMKRRLSVAISLVGDPAVVYLDEPSTGLDPASRQLLWNVIKRARRQRAVVLTTHSMEEAEALCDRLGIFVGGRLQCVGNPKDLVARFGGYLSFTITTSAGQEAAAAAIVRSLSPAARLVYALGGTQKYELPVGEAAIDAIFARMEAVKASKEVDLVDWGVSNATLEEVFIRITREAGVRMSAFA
ncbi:ABC transporter A family member 7-like isoform A [Chlorella sorokiniana]|uniref:ABC transporter A family member 7-like isoform A n=1 Tax=Chlorella sorokiniana TaxID=3076 RepID=A0A2P6TJN0_CHLSO|nr:ABC transporter A family member 7-like isoform A [Chlorella sorokiniana]|eukprot:PRW44292.1 ABC transporter A family member 7-like isoform A [Chlorella sorokiniana]